MARYWILGNGCLQVVYLTLLWRTCRHNPYITSLSLVYGSLGLALIYGIPALFYLLASEWTKSRDRVFIVWGCATSVLMSLLCLIPGYV